jgi:hypothetical protein
MVKTCPALQGTQSVVAMFAAQLRSLRYNLMLAFCFHFLSIPLVLLCPAHLIHLNSSILLIFCEDKNYDVADYVISYNLVLLRLAQAPILCSQTLFIFILH